MAGIYQRIYFMQGFVHTVFFWLRDKHDDQARQQLQSGLLALTQIDLIRHAWIGTPAATDRPVIDSSYDFSLTFVFDNAADQDAYQDHPDHSRFVDTCKDLWSKVVVYDAQSVG